MHSPVATTTQALLSLPATGHRLSPGSHHEVSLHDRRPTQPRSSRPWSRHHNRSGRSPQGVNDASRCGIATGHARPPPDAGATRHLRGTASGPPRHATEVTHRPHRNKTGFPILPRLGVTNHCRLEPRGALTMPAKSLTTTAGYSLAKPSTVAPTVGANVIICRTRPCGPALR